MMQTNGPVSRPSAAPSRSSSAIPRPHPDTGLVYRPRLPHEIPSEPEEIVYLIDAGQFLAWPSNQPVGFELPAGAGDQDFDDGDGRDRKEHPDHAKQDGSSQDPDHHHERVKVDRAPDDNRFIHNVFSHLAQAPPPAT